MPRYDASRYDPPAPLAIVSLRPSAGGPLVHDVLLLIDTGADITMLPRWAVAALGITPKPARYEVVAFDGSRTMAEAVDLEMLFLRRAFGGRYLLSDDDHGILGRDVLASLKLLLDGPGQQWTEAGQTA